MLDKIEHAYLAEMRVVVLIAATVALVICVIGTQLFFSSQANFT